MPHPLLLTVATAPSLGLRCYSLLRRAVIETVCPALCLSNYDPLGQDSHTCSIT